RNERETGLFVQPAHQGLKPPRLRYGVMVQQSDESAARFEYARIVAAGKTSILRHDDQAHMWKSLAHVGGGSVGRRVVDENRFGAHAMLCRDGVEAGVDVLPAIPGDDDDRNQWIGSHRDTTAPADIRPPRCAGTPRA